MIDDVTKQNGDKVGMAIGAGRPHFDLPRFALCDLSESHRGNTGPIRIRSV